MAKQILDEAAINALSGLTHPVQICDARGRVLGSFYPTLDLSEWEPVDANKAEITEAEFRRRLASNQRRYTTSELIERLEKS